ncbi:Hypothetical protein CINCED_3A023052 [Cinara cedri]|uniref:USP domain-containing protein n=1 Tax=Cinara cedri TaxID=506608 RepID=A0A5E4MF05_9HEMI|nr:Hypothetical protein CINCED_3A023052 [Cinara cedri]
MSQKRSFEDTHSVKKLCNRVSVLSNEHGENKEFSTRKRCSSVSYEQCSSYKKMKLQEIEDEVIVKREENTKQLTPTKNVEENIAHTSDKPRLLPALLLNGNLSSVIKIDEQKYNIYNTCAFDSIAIIISRAFVDNSAYTDFVDANSNSEFLNFCKSVAFIDSSENLNKQRVKMLRRIFNENSEAPNLKTINCECNVIKIICDLLKEYPSAKNHIRCSNNSCKNANTWRNSSTIILDVKELKDLKNLEGILKEYTKLRKYNCGRCTEKITAKRALSNHLFIETDQLKKTSQFTMADIPSEISVENYRFVLNGSVNFESGHYTSQVLRLKQNVWETHNDLRKYIKICTVPEKLIVNPHLVVYTKE